MIISVCRWVVVLALAAPVAHAVPGFAHVRESVSTVSVAKSASMDLRYHDGALSGEIRNREIGRVLCDLVRVSGARFILSGGSLPDRAVWVRLSNTTLPIALRQILGGLSFVVYPRADGVAVKVFSNEKRPWKGRRARDEALRCDGAGDRNARLSKVSGAGGADAGRDTAAAESLAGTFAEANGLRAAEETPGPRAVDQVEADGVAEQESFYQRVGQAAEGLQSEDPKRRRDAVHEWLELKDRRASPALVELALTPSGSSNRARLRVVDTLWRHAADLEFSDEVSVEGLRALAEDGDPDVASIAQEALQDMGEYLQTDEPH